ncbi:hypothetical protein HK107_14715 [Parvularcula sp. ZS-1/3]|uniref:Uncharacterized protein n=1 Tax=Parvularcula mediterranea TaxID=2732508 RepID=A0A7Y3RNY1_9PROT|nr:hypothetical protein [Parvularcula mediterranea]NNU17581.1 hypothetical protein [Parvularcula mediterranea]
MSGVDLPFAQEPEVETNSLAEKGRWLKSAFAARLGEPLIWLAVVVLLFFVLDTGLRAYCQGGRCGVGLGPAGGLLNIALLLGIGFTLKASFGRYLQERTQWLAALLAVIPVAYLLAYPRVTVPAPAAAQVVTEPQAVTPSPVNPAQTEAITAELEAASAMLAAAEEQQRRLRSEVAALSARLEALEAAPPVTEEAVRAIAAETLQGVEAADEEALSVLLEEREDALEAAVADRLRREASLATVGPRIAEAGPLVREVPALSEELQQVAERLELSEAGVEALATDPDRQSCITTRLAERGALMTMNQRLNPERFADYLAPCFE